MTMVIYYFSGTGNSLYIAKNIAKKANGTLKAITLENENSEIIAEEECVGLVFPTHYSDMPNCVEQFARKLKSSAKYVFAVSTYSGGKGDTINNLRRILKETGLELNAVYGVHMPQNQFLKPSEKHQDLYREADKMVDKIVENINQLKNGEYYSSVLMDILQRPLGPLLESGYMKYLIKMTGEKSSKTKKELIALMDKTFKVTEGCSGCSICAQVCPVQNIEIIENKPCWQHRCENCMACYNYCPQKAIETLMAKDGYRYKHPEITLKEMMLQKNQ